VEESLLSSAPNLQAPTTESDHVTSWFSDQVSSVRSGDLAHVSRIAQHQRQIDQVPPTHSPEATAERVITTRQQPGPAGSAHFVGRPLCEPLASRQTLSRQAIGLGVRTVRYRPGYGWIRATGRRSCITNISRRLPCYWGRFVIRAAAGTTPRRGDRMVGGKRRAMAPERRGKGDAGPPEPSGSTEHSSRRAPRHAWSGTRRCCSQKEKNGCIPHSRHQPFFSPCD
jgi:hypothetical protein